MKKALGRDANTVRWL